MGKDNLIFKLDQLEYQIHFMNNDVESFTPRFKQTSQFFNSKSRKINKKVSRLLATSTQEQLAKDINDLRLKILDQKFHYVKQRLHSLWVKNATLLKDQKVSKIGLEKYIEYLTFSKLAKLTVALMGGIKNSPEWFHTHNLYEISIEKENELNPSKIYNEVFVKNNLNSINSKLLNDKTVKELLVTYENGIHVLLNQRDKMTRAESSNSRETKKDKEKTPQKGSQEETSLRSNDDSEGSNDDEDEEEGKVSEVNSEVEEALLDQYKDLLVGTDEESEGEYQLNPTVDYNQVTDEEPSADEESDAEEDDSLESNSRPSKKAKFDLPELMNGYYSGDESDSYEEDDVARKQLANEPKKKNRRGQRARQKIWEKKYGSQAKHVQREYEKQRQEKEKRQTEFEERQAKREARAAQMAESSRSRIPSSSTPQPQAVAQSNFAAVDKPIHPSWEAKRIADEKLKNVKFQGKKITFD